RQAKPTLVLMVRGTLALTLRPEAEAQPPDATTCIDVRGCRVFAERRQASACRTTFLRFAAKGLSRISLPCGRTTFLRFAGISVGAATSLPCPCGATFLRLAATTFWGEAASGVWWGGVGLGVLSPGRFYPRRSRVRYVCRAMGRPGTVESLSRESL